MSRFLIRTDAGLERGLGHLVRCVVLAKALRARGHICTLLLDHNDPRWLVFCDPVPVVALYTGETGFFDEVTDASHTVKMLTALPADWVIVDDYRLSVEWESRVRQTGVQLMAIDDVCRQHECDLILDFKWRGPGTPQAYDACVPAPALRLLGPDFVLLDVAYKNRLPAGSKPMAPFVVMVGLGGGGDLRMTQQIVERLLTLEAIDLAIWPVVGPASCDAESFQAWCASQPRVSPIVGESDLSGWFARAHCYVGAAGGVMYQLLAMGVPALTFAISANQQTPRYELEGVGHFFHVPQWGAEELALLPGFIETVYAHYPRVQALTQAGERRIDGAGAERVAAVLSGEPVAAVLPESTNRHVRQGDVGWQTIAGQYAVRPVDDTDINAYLAARNLPANQHNMIQSSDIHPLAHYAWWFGAERLSYQMTHAGHPRLYIWHALREVGEVHALIGGWFICDAAAGQQDALVALKWQLDHCDTLFPGVPWMAVIHRENHAVRLMNQYLGFQDVLPGDRHYPTIQQLFPNADNTVYHYVTRG